MCAHWGCRGSRQKEVCHRKAFQELTGSDPRRAMEETLPSTCLCETFRHSLIHASLSPVLAFLSSSLAHPVLCPPASPGFPPLPFLARPPLTRRSRRVSTLPPVMRKRNPPQMLTFLMFSCYSYLTNCRAHGGASPSPPRGQERRGHGKWWGRLLGL